jgi:DNA/RNA-binding domain of Phe-tRNA-synthetase-like protein
MLAENFKNGTTPPALQQEYLDEQRRVRERIGDTPLSELPTLAAWRRAFSAFGVEPTKYRSAAEALLRRLTKKGDIPGINAVVDIYNLISIRYALPASAFDLRHMQGVITVRFAVGDERFTPLGEAFVEHPEPGEVIFSDDTGMVLARRWCWRQSQESAALDDSRQLLFVIEAQHAGAEAGVTSALGELQDLLSTYVGGQFTACLITAAGIRSA